ncbi:putative oxidoreductase, partial [Talaromyces proteolyticus]
MAPIRVGLIGLSSSHTSGQGVGVWASVAHLPHLLSSPIYEIVALSNSSVEAAQKAILHYKLPAETKAYGSPEDLANDPDVDLVVVCVVVMKHFELLKPALLAKKDVFVEWPLGSSLAQAEELTSLARKNGVKTIVGLQSRADSLVNKVKEVISQGKIGKVVSSYAIGSTSAVPSDFWFEGGEYYLDFKSGGNLFTIHFGHFLDSFTDVLGEFADVQSILKNTIPTLPILGADGQVKDPKYPKTAPDHIVIQGTLKSGAIASLSYRTVKSTADGIGINWIISGTKGEIQITTPESNWQMSDPKRKLRLRVGNEGPVEIDFLRREEKDSILTDRRSINVAAMYEAFAIDDEAHYATFDSALRTHILLEEI